MEDETMDMVDEHVDTEVRQMEEDKSQLILDRIMGEVLDFRLTEALTVEQSILIKEDIKKILDEMLSV